MGSEQSRLSADARRLNGRRAVITGAARGIGAEIARSYRRHGADLVLVDIDDDAVRELAKSLEAESVVVDLADARATVAAVSEAIDVLGGIDILVNNAGILRTAPILHSTVEDWDLTFDVNVRAVFLATQTASRAMLRQPIRARRRGTIINMASMGGKLGSANQAHYCASKAAVIAFTRVSAMELGPEGITVNCICPGYVLTEMGSAERTEDMARDWAAKSPLNRLAEPGDVADMALFLASDEASYCTGQAMNVSGGMVMH